MKILHASDLHYSPGNLVEADRCFGHAVEQAIVHDVAVAMLTGDLTDHALDGHSPALLALAKRIKQLADHCPVFLLQGTFSHEPVGLLKMLEMIGARHPIIVSDKIGMIGLSQGKWLEYDPTYTDVQYDLVITSVPTVNKAELALVVGADNASVEMGNHLAALLGLFGPANAALRRRGVPTVLASHGTVDGSLNENGVPMAGLDHEFSLGALFSAQTSATMLGHIHMHQQWTREHDGRTQRIAYPGSIGRYHYGELGEKYCLIWEVSADTADFIQVQTPSKRMIEIAFEGVPNLDELATVAEQCRGAFVRVRYSVDEEFAKTVDRQAIKQVLGGAAEVKIEGEVLTIQRQRCAGISSLTSTDERFMKWCEFTSTPIDGLAERLAMLQTMAPEDIASAFNLTNKRSGLAAPKPSGQPAQAVQSEDFLEDCPF
jgi:DNA repair protein SbcD/Mre11